MISPIMAALLPELRNGLARASNAGAHAGGNSLFAAASSTDWAVSTLLVPEQIQLVNSAV